MTDNITYMPRNINNLKNNIAEFTQIIQNYQEKAFQAALRHRQQENRRRNSKHPGLIMQFQTGDWVLVSNKNTKREGNKTKLNWTGPYQIKQIVSQNVYVVENLYGKQRTVHASFLWFYESPSFRPSDNLRQIFKHDFDELEVESILSIKVIGNKYELRIKWLGFDEPTWEPIENIYDSLPVLTIDFLSRQKTKQADDAKTYLNQRRKTTQKVSRILVAKYFDRQTNNFQESTSINPE